jgi:uncharacterized membrane protein YkoI
MFRQLLAVAFASVFAFGAVAASASAAADPKQRQHQKYHSSIQVPHDDSNASEEQVANKGEANEHEDDADEANYQSLAKITKEQAIKAATKRVRGKVGGASLDNEDGNLVYSVEIRTSSGVFDVKVDAGNAKVLFIDKD